jgi:signal transduction histidine kinase/PAS domain-containing protein
MKRSGSRKSASATAALLETQEAGSLIAELLEAMASAGSEDELLGQVLLILTRRLNATALYLAVSKPGGAFGYRICRETRLDEDSERGLTSFIERMLRSASGTFPPEIFDSFAFLSGLSRLVVKSDSLSSERVLLFVFGGKDLSADAFRAPLRLIEMRLANLRMQATMERRTRNLSGLHKSAEGMSRMLLNSTELLESITQEARVILRVDAAAVLAPEDDSKLNYTVRASSGFPSGKIPLSPHLFSRAFEEFQAKPRKAVVYHGLEDQVFLLVPLLQRGIPASALFLYSHSPEFQLTDDLQQITEIFGDWVSMTMENAVMFEKVLNSQREWENTFDSIVDPIYIIDSEYRLKKMNKSLAGLTMKLIKVPEDRNCYRHLFHRNTICPWCPVPRGMQSEQPVTVEAPLFSGGIWQIQSFPFTNKAGQRTGSIHVLRDMTILKSMQEQLIESEKMASAGKLISGVAHEVRNPLFGISTTARALANELGNKEELKPYLDIITSETARLNRLMEELLNYSRPVQIDKNPSDIGEIIGGVIREFEQHPSGQNASIRLFASDAVPAIAVDSNKIKQVLINLFENAIQHSRETPQIDVFLEHLSLSTPPGIMMVIKDHGKGISPENLNRIFDPFFTTRQKGTGLGLSIVRKVIHDHGGRIAVESLQGVGTTFRIGLPITTVKA